MREEFPKKYDFRLERDIYKFWEENEAFLPNSERKTAKKTVKKTPKKGAAPTEVERFMMTLPPPNVTGILHSGHGLMLSIQDAIVRYHRMQGKDTLWLPATDHAWIATQVKVEDKLREQKKDRETLGRNAFVKEVRDWAIKSRSTINSQTKAMGASLDWSREEFTLSERLSRAVRKSFSNLYDQWLIYEWTRIVNWSIGTQSVISDIEIEYREEEWKLYYLKYFLEGKGDAITIATTRPETIFADVAVAVSPHDKRYKKLVWKKVLIPIINRPIPIIIDESVDMTFGTGALKVTPTHDPVDFTIWQKHNLPMDIFALDKKGKYTKHAGESYEGRDITSSYEGLIQELDEIGNLERIEKYTHTVPYCERSNTRIQPLLSSQWFVDVSGAAKDSLEAIDSGELQVHPERFKHDFHQWLDNIQPWCISRQLWRGHRIPVWKSKQKKIYVFDEDTIFAYTQEHKKEKKNTILAMIIFNSIADSRLSKTFSLEELLDTLTKESIVPHNWAVVASYVKMYRTKFASNDALLKELDTLEGIFADGATEKEIEKIVDALENTYFIEKDRDQYSFNIDLLAQDWDSELQQEEDVLDTWFSSALRPFSTLGWPDETPDLEKYYPNDLLETWYDIIFFWVARMMMMGAVNTKQMPFKAVYFHGIVRDEKWRKMSKSLWNALDPVKVIEKYGADALRCALLVGTTPGNDSNFSETKTEYYFRFANKLWNATRFISMKVFWDEKKWDISIDLDALAEDLQMHMESLNHFDQWILQRINQVVIESERAFSQFQLGEFAHQVIQLIYGDFCDWYIEISKREKSEYTDKVLLYALGNQLKLLHPFMPFVTEKLRQLSHFEGMLIESKRPTVLQEIPKDFKIAILMDMITGWRNLRSEQKVKPHEKVDIVVQANISFNNFIKEYEQLVKDLAWADQIQYNREDEEITDEYVTQLVVDMKIGLKAKREINKKEVLAQLEKQLVEEERFMQGLKTMLANPSFATNATGKIVEEKQQKLAEVKMKVTKLKLDIAKLKMDI